MKNKLFILLFAGLMFTSCGTVFTGGKAKVTLTTPATQGTKVLVNGNEKGFTPLTLKLKADDVLSFEKDGFATKQVIVSGKFNSISILNLTNLLGWAIDAVTGALKVPEERLYTVTLKEIE